MEKVTLGRTGITVNRNGFGALPNSTSNWRRLQQQF